MAKKKSESEPKFKFATVVDRKSDKLLSGDRYELFWELDPSQGVNFYLPASVGGSIKPNDELLLTYGSKERFVMVKSVEPTQPGSKTLRVEAVGIPKIFLHPGVYGFRRRQPVSDAVSDFRSVSESTTQITPQK